MFPNIDAERARRKMSQQFAAETIGVSAKTFQNWMTGKTEIPASALLKMADMFGCSVDYLLGRNSPNNQPN